jgi:hypothetical protein
MKACRMISISEVGKNPFALAALMTTTIPASFRYVSIRHGGAKLSTDKEINGLSMGAVGRGTVIEYVEAYAIADDGFRILRWHGQHQVPGQCILTMMTHSITDMGYRGTNQFWFAIQAPDARNYGGEWNNQINEIVTTNLLTPQADFKVYNATFIGSGTSNTNTTGGRNAAVILRPYCRIQGV